MSSATGHLPLRPALKWRAFQALGMAAGFGGEAAAALTPLAGACACLLAPAPRHAVAANLRCLLPEAPEPEIRRLCRGVFRSVVRYYVELMQLPTRDLRAAHDTTAVHGYEHFEAARRQGEGVIIASIHLGPAELLLHAFAVRGVQYTAMVERLEPAGLRDLFQRLREVHGHRYVFAGRAGARTLLKTLRAGGVVALLIDRDLTGNGMEIPFGAAAMRVPTGAIDLARVSGAPIVPTIARWDRGRRRTAVFMPPLRIERRDRGEAATRAALTELLARFLPYLRAHPEQWLVLQPLLRPSRHAGGAGYTET